MITSMIIFLIPFMTVAFLPLPLKIISSNDLDEMGICLEDLDLTLLSCPAQRSEHNFSKVTTVYGNA